VPVGIVGLKNEGRFS